MQTERASPRKPAGTGAAAAAADDDVMQLHVGERLNGWSQWEARDPGEAQPLPRWQKLSRAAVANHFLLGKDIQVFNVASHSCANQNQ